MPTVDEYAQLSLRVYQRAPNNRIPVPIESGWSELFWIPDAAVSGFSAGVYKRGNEIVIAYTGTNEKQAVDFLVANIPAGAALPSAQVIEAMSLYMQVKREYLIPK